MSHRYVSIPPAASASPVTFDPVAGPAQVLQALLDPHGAVLPAVLALALAVVHVGAGRLTASERSIRNSALSLSAGASVAYVFVHVLPEISETSRRLPSEELPLSHHAYLVTLLGFVAYYGLERVVRCSRDDPDAGVRRGVFWFHVAAFALYNALIGYLLFHREAPGVGSLLLYAGAMGLHFLVIDFGLWAHHREVYDDRGRWTLAGAVLAGAVLGALTELDRVLLGGLFAFLAGGIVLNVIKEELPAETDSRFWPFAFGVVGYALLLLAV